MADVIVLAWVLGAAFVLWWPLLFHLQRRMEDRLVREDEALDALFIRILDDLPRGHTAPKPANWDG